METQEEMTQGRGFIRTQSPSSFSVLMEKCRHLGSPRTKPTVVRSHNPPPAPSTAGALAAPQVVPPSLTFPVGHEHGSWGVVGAGPGHPHSKPPPCPTLVRVGSRGRGQRAPLTLGRTGGPRQHATLHRLFQKPRRVGSQKRSGHGASAGASVQAGRGAPFWGARSPRHGWVRGQQLGLRPSHHPASRLGSVCTAGVGPGWSPPAVSPGAPLRVTGTPPM